MKDDSINLVHTHFFPRLYFLIVRIFNKDLKKKIRESYNRLTDIISSGQTIYGVNTGFGKLSQVKIKEHEMKVLQNNLLMSHAAGVGESTPSSIVIAAPPLFQISDMFKRPLAPPE